MASYRRYRSRNPMIIRHAYLRQNPDPPDRSNICSRWNARQQLNPLIE
jgi:hypothetical protein